MEKVQKFSELNEDNTKAKGLDIKNEYTKLINDPDNKILDLGVVDGVSDTAIYNLKQTYKNALIQVVDGHYIMSIKENKKNKNKDMNIVKKFDEFLSESSENVDMLFNDIENAVGNNESLLIQSQPGVQLGEDISEILDELIETKLIDSYQLIDGITTNIEDIDYDNDVIVIDGVDSISFQDFMETFDYLMEDNIITIAVANSIPNRDIKNLFDNVV